MRILLVYPKYPDTFWSFKYALKFVFKKAGHPPLGLLTVASLLPRDFELKLVDMNVEKLKEKHILWADHVFIGAMAIQKKSAVEVIARCKALGAKVVAGGPLFTTAHEEFPDVDHFVLGEAEITLPQFIEDLRNATPKQIYTSEQKADITTTPLPMWEILNMKKYASMNVQYSRGCPFNCDFCDITLLYGRVPRTKTTAQVIQELDRIYSMGWRGNVFFVDDNFIGNKRKLKSDVLPAIIKWMDERKHPFTYITQASIELADDEELMTQMAKAGFDAVFVGIETPNEDGLTECTKHQNKGRDLVATVKKIQHFGLQVHAGFIVGFDSDPSTIFEKQIKFIQQSGITTAMVGLLNAFKGTSLYQRLEKENRLVKDISGDNTDCSINFVPKMNYDTLIDGYKKILATIYAPKNYYARVRVFLREYQPIQKPSVKISMTQFFGFLRSIVRLGVIGKERVQYWKLLIWSLFRRPRLFPLASTLAVYGFHFRRVFEKNM